jgi:hypothetical protein
MRTLHTYISALKVYWGGGSAAAKKWHILYKLRKNAKYFATVCTGKYTVVFSTCRLSRFNAIKTNPNEQLQLKTSQNECIMIDDTLGNGFE